MTALTTAAWIAHDMSLAAGFGGSLFGKMALQPAVKLISSTPERSKVVHEVWKDYSIVNAISLGTAVATWIAGRVMISGRVIDRQTRALVIAKDVLLSTSAVTGLCNMIFGSLEGQKKLSAVNESGNGLDSQDKVRVLRKTMDVLGTVNLVASAGVIGLTAVLGMKAGKSPTWKLLSRFLP